jgi:hypothetical protein
LLTSSIYIGFINISFLGDRQDENEQDGTESAANTVEEREAEKLNVSTLGYNRHIA